MYGKKKQRMGKKKERIETLRFFKWKMIES